MKIKWYAYWHRNSRFNVKKYTKNGLYVQDRESDFVLKITRPFEARNKEEAIRKGKELLR